MGSWNATDALDRLHRDGDVASAVQHRADYVNRTQQECIETRPCRSSSRVIASISGCPDTDGPWRPVAITILVNRRHDAGNRLMRTVLSDATINSYIADLWF